jgi:hypothetical protein
LRFCVAIASWWWAATAAAGILDRSCFARADVGTISGNPMEFTTPDGQLDGYDGVAKRLLQISEADRILQTSGAGTYSGAADARSIWCWRS